MSELVATMSAGAPADSGAEYVPGVCNIGSEEIARRRRAGHLGAVVTLALLVALVAVQAPPPVRFLIALPVAGTAVSYLQAWLKFCAAFGSAGVFNLGSLGRREIVDDPIARARDRRRAMQIFVAGALIGLVVGIVAALLP